jgi:hypothetical protein
MKTIQEVKDFFFDELNVPEHEKKNKCRVLEKLAREILLKNESIILNGKVKWFGISRIGLGVCEVFLHENRKVTCMID